MDGDAFSSSSAIKGLCAPRNARKNGSVARSSRNGQKTSPAPGPPDAFPLDNPPLRSETPLEASPQAVKTVVPASPAPPPTTSPSAQPPASAAPESPERNPDERTLTEAAGPLYLFASNQPILKTSSQPDGYLKYRERFLAGCGNPQDPVEVLLIESLVLAFHNAGRMVFQSAAATDSDTVIAYEGAASRLMAELRRGALALQEYRAKGRDIERGKAEEAQLAKPKAERDKNGKATDPHPKRRTAKKKASNGKVGSNDHSEMPPWLQKRFEFPTPVESPLDELIVCVGKG